jgi:hypothetical protein
MADLMNFSITRNGETENGIPFFEIKGDVLDSKTGGVLTKINTSFPDLFSSLNQEEIDELIEPLIMKIIFRRVETYQELAKLKIKAIGGE